MPDDQVVENTATRFTLNPEHLKVLNDLGGRLGADDFTCVVTALSGFLSDFKVDDLQRLLSLKVLFGNLMPKTAKRLDQAVASAEDGEPIVLHATYQCSKHRADRMHINWYTSDDHTVRIMVEAMPHPRSIAG